ncbi:MAG TPA: hypothetical protein VGL91_08500 [Acidobacteriota bacterium]
MKNRPFLHSRWWLVSCLFALMPNSGFGQVDTGSIVQRQILSKAQDFTK